MLLDNVGYIYQTTYGYPVELCTSTTCNGSKVTGITGLGTVVATEVIPDSETVSYTYDAGGDKQSIATNVAGVDHTIVSGVQRNVRGQTVEVIYGNSVQQYHCYNDGVTCNAVTQVNTDQRVNQLVTVASGTTQNYHYLFDANKNVTSVVDSTDGSKTWWYAYDSADRLISASQTGLSLAYVYDNTGDMTSKESVAQAYPASGAGSVHPHALCSTGRTSCTTGTVYSYDANGNLSSRSDGLAIAWNAENMAVHESGGSFSTTQRWFLGESIWKKTQGTNTYYYLPNIRVENGLARKFYGAFAEQSTDGSFKYYQNDHLGSASLVTDSSGTQILKETYKPFGETQSNVGSFSQPTYQFNFKEKEEDGTLFYDYGARLYCPTIARWLSPDTDLKDGLNRYTYVSNNPLRYDDPTGHQEQDPSEILQTFGREMGNGTIVIQMGDHQVTGTSQARSTPMGSRTPSTSSRIASGRSWG